MKKIILSFIVIATLLFGLLMTNGCSTKKAVSKATTNKVTIDFWSAPNPPQTKFWKQMADEYAKVNTNVKVNVTPMPETPSSEAGIQSAIAGGSAPTMSENIFRGFAAQLQESQAIVPLDTLPGWNDIIKARNMKNTIAGWKFSDGHQYVIPISSNSMLWGWRTDILKSLGYNAPPKTYSEVIALGIKLKAKYPDKFIWANSDIATNTWWARWFDFFMLYDAASNGNKFINGTKFVGNDKAGIATLQFISDLVKNKLLLTQKATDPFETGTSVMSTIGPWTFAGWKEKFPELKLDKNYVLTPAPVPDGVSTTKVKTFADTKGIVIYAQASPEKQKAAMEFVKWVFSNPQHDLTWFTMTSLPPARDDLNTNPMFTNYLKTNPQLQMYAATIPDAIPPMDNAKFNELQTAIGDKAIVPLVTGKLSPEKAWEAMKKAMIEGVK